MLDLSYSDPTQNEIKKHLLDTETLLSMAAGDASGYNVKAQIVCLPDLGFPRGIKRLYGGFFVGAFYYWDTPHPMVPVDATVNSCGVSVFKLKRELSSEKAFLKRVFNAIELTSQTSYNWNFNTSNHFISYSRIENYNGFLVPGDYLILHSSACEFKKQINGLYPVSGNWYSDSIRTIRLNNSNRSLRYICGDIAEQFISVAQFLPQYNQHRHRVFAELILGTNNIDNEAIYQPHYGMPTKNSIAIGCQSLVNDNKYLLLTNKESPMYYIKASDNRTNTISIDKRNFTLVPHGLGNRSLVDPTLIFNQNQIVLNRKVYNLNDSFEFGKEIIVRDLNSDVSHKNKDKIFDQIFMKCPGEIICELMPIYNYNRSTVYTGS